MGILKKFKSIDMYGMPVGVNYRGSDTYKTKLGALGTLLTWICVLGYGISKIILLVNKSEPSKNSLIEFDNESFDSILDVKDQSFKVFF